MWEYFFPSRAASVALSDSRASREGVFQSAPRTEALGDPDYPRSSGFQPSFNPRPAPKRGAIDAGASRDADHVVSIRAPRRSAGR